MQVVGLLSQDLPQTGHFGDYAGRASHCNDDSVGSETDDGRDVGNSSDNSIDLLASD